MLASRKAKQCAVCGGAFSPRDSFQKVCGRFDCTVDFTRMKVAARRLADENMGTSTAYRLSGSSAKDALSSQHRLTQRVFNRMRVLEELHWFQRRGLRPECISCGMENATWSCGHYKTVGARSELRYSRANTALQCLELCNCDLSGNIEGNQYTRGYKQGLIDRFGLRVGSQRIDYLEHFTGITDWCWQDLKRFRARCAFRVRELEAMGVGS
jgi:hypothetical protein